MQLKGRKSRFRPPVAAVDQQIKNEATRPAEQSGGGVVQSRPGRGRPRQSLLWAGLVGGLTLGLTWLALWLTPPERQVLVGLEDTSPYTTSFYLPEKNASFSYRWTRPEWQLRFAAVGSRPYQLRLALLSPAQNPLEVTDSAGRLIATFSPTAELQTYRLTIPAGAVTSSGDLLLYFKTARYIPATPDQRELGLVVASLDLKGQGLSLPPLVVIVIGLAVYGLGPRLLRVRRKRLIYRLALLVATGLVGLITFWHISPDYRFEPDDPTLDAALSGFYKAERNEAYAYRWAQPDWQLNLPQIERGNYELRLGALAPEPVTVSLTDSLSGQILTTFQVTDRWKLYTLALPSDGQLQLAFHSPGYLSPFDSDDRRLGLMISQLDLKRQNESGLLWLALAWLAYLLLLFPLVISVFKSDQTSEIRNQKLEIRNQVSGISDQVSGISDQVLGISDQVSGISNQPITAQLPTPDPQPSVLSPQSSFFSPQSSALIPLALLGFGLRAINPGALSIFIDEALHIRAAQMVQAGGGLDGLFVMAIDSKALHGWVLAGMYGLVGADQFLLWARLFSALCGLVTLLACYGLAARLFSVRAGLVAAGLWAILPFAVWHDRLALVDPLMTTLVSLALYFSLRGLEVSGRWAGLGYGLLAGFCLTTALLTKLPALLIAPAPLLALALLYRPAEWKWRWPRLGPIYAIFGLTVLPVIALYNGRWGGGQQEDKLSGPQLGLLWDNLLTLAQWSYTYLTLPLSLLIVLGWRFAFSQNWRVALFLGLTALLPGLVMAATARTLYPRYLLFCLVPALVMAAGGLVYGLDRLRESLKPGAKRYLAPLVAVGLLLLSLPALWFDFQTVTDPAQVSLPKVDRFQYIEGWPAGGKVEQMATYLRDSEPQNGQVLTVIGADYISYSALQIYLAPRPALNLLFAAGMSPVRLEKKVRTALTSGPTFLLLIEPKYNELLQNYRQTYPDLTFQPTLTLDRPGGQYRLVAYRLLGRANPPARAFV